MATTGAPPPHQISGELQPKYTGVRKRKWGKWVSEIRLPNSRERIWLGSYDSPEKAARAFDAALFCLRGRNANFNFPNNPPEILGGESLSPHSIQIVAARYANESTPTPATVEMDADAEQQNHAPPSVAAPAESGMDWAFLSMLDCNNEIGQEFGYFTGLENTGYGYDPPSIFNDDQNWDECSYNQSSLWNFN